jgi:hypothetical protein
VSFKGFGFTLAWLLVSVSSSAWADVIYQYTGPAFTDFFPGSPYTTSDFVSATFQLPNALGGGLSNQTVCLDDCAIPFSIGATNAAGIPTNWAFFNTSEELQFISAALTISDMDRATGTPEDASVSYTPSAQFWSMTPVPKLFLLTLTLSTFGLATLGAATRRRTA